MGRVRAVRWVVGVGVVAMMATACSGTPTPETAAPKSSGGGWIGADGALEWAADGGVGGAAGIAMAADSAGTAPASTVASPQGGVPDPQVDLGLSAGSVDDNATWDDFLRYREAFLNVHRAEVHDLVVEGRNVITVVDGAGHPVLGALVTVRALDGTVVEKVRTTADGRALVFVPLDGLVSQQRTDPSPYTAVVEMGGQSAEVELAGASREHRVVLDGVQQPGTVKLDVLFLIDATGSMGDEIDRLKAHMTSVADKVAAMESKPDVRFAMTVYRDEGDLFLNRTFDFTNDVASFTAALDEVVANGGGDTPEALSEALGAALAQPSWRGDDTVKLAILVADAEPHVERTPDYLASVAQAREMGVKILPVASSGSSDVAEFVFRQLAQATLGRFTFLTYGADGASPGTSTPLHVTDYSVLSLDALVTQLVADELTVRAF